MAVYGSLCRAMSLRVLAPEAPGDRGLVLNLTRPFQPLWYHLHYVACPRILTVDGFFGVLFRCDPSLRATEDEVYREIFGAQSSGLSGRRGCGGGGATARLPQVPSVGSTPAPPPRFAASSLVGSVREHLMCAYLRSRLAASGGMAPRHLGVIMDGNRRISRQNRLGSVVDGHRQGGRKLLEVLTWSMSVGIHNLTLWALSEDNLKRGRQELDPLFALITDFIHDIVLGDSPISVLDIRFRAVGDRCLLPAKLNQIIDAAELATQGNRSFNMQLALGYGGQSKVVRAVKLGVKSHAPEQSATIEEALSNLTVVDVSKHTYSSELGLPPIDAILGTSGENRLSGFALWESQAAEISFV
ncbi:protein MpCPT3 [Marchantia polymorpha subsp. ruderalis]